MKTVAIILTILSFSWLFASTVSAQPGKYAGPALKKLIGTQYADERNITALQNYQHIQGTLISSLDVANRLFLNIYTRGTTRVVIFSAAMDTSFSRFEILDVLLVQQVQPGWEIKTGVCRLNKKDDIEIVALAKTAEKAYFTVIKRAWRCDRTQKIFTAIHAKEVDCLNEGHEQY
jgi:hypothetical protein